MEAAGVGEHRAKLVGSLFYVWFSPVRPRCIYISATFAPTIFIHGTADTTVLPQSSIDFYSKLHALNVPTALTLIQGANHAFDNNAFDAIEVMAASIDLFLDRLLITKAAYPGFGGGGGGRGGGRGGGGGGRGRGGAPGGPPPGGAAPGGAAPGGAAPGGRGQ
jgi:hypothetical protein